MTGALAKHHASIFAWLGLVLVIGTAARALALASQVADAYALAETKSEEAFAMVVEYSELDLEIQKITGLFIAQADQFTGDDQKTKITTAQEATSVVGDSMDKIAMQEKRRDELRSQMNARIDQAREVLASARYQQHEFRGSMRGLGLGFICGLGSWAYAWISRTPTAVRDRKEPTRGSGTRLN